MSKNEITKKDSEVKEVKPAEPAKPAKPEKRKLKFGDRSDAALIRDMDPMHVLMGHLYGSRNDNEAHILVNVKLDPIYAWLEKHKNDDPEFKYTFFHLIVTAVLKTIILKPKLNRFVANKRYYQRFDRTATFIVKRQFTESAGEGMCVVYGDESLNVFDIHEKIKKYVLPARTGKTSKNENDMDFASFLPDFIVRFLMNITRWLDDHGKMPRSLIEGETNHCSVFLTNIGSIGLNCGYHHLPHWGTTSLFIVVGEKKLTPFYDKTGACEVHETIDLGLTIDERIADGYYYSKAVKLLKHLLENPELLEKPLGEEIEL